MPNRKIVLAFAAVYVLWGSTYLAIRFSIETIPPFLMAGSRFAIAGTILYLWSRRGASRPPSAIEWRSALIIGTALLAISNGAVTWSEQRVPSGITALLVATVPMWILILDWFRRDGVRPTRRTFAGLIIGFAGTLLLIGPANIMGKNKIDLVGAGVLMMCCFSWAKGSLYSRRAVLPESPLQAAAMEMIAGGVILLIVSLASGEMGRFHPSAVSLRSVLSELYLIFFGAIVGFTAYAWLIRVALPSRVATYAYVNPVIAIFMGWLFAGEQLTAQEIVAAAVIILAVVLIITAQAARSRTPSPAPSTDRILLAAQREDVEPC